jgi:hypothetical protein
VSLVLEALRKLDREKGRDERGFVVMAAAPWPSRAARRHPLWAAVGLAAVAAVAMAFVMRGTRPSAPAPPAAAAAVKSSLPPAMPPSAPAATLAPTRAANPPTPAPVRRATPAASPSAAALRLQAVSQRDGQPIAIINDRLVRVGDEVEGQRVLAIRADEVDLEIQGRRTTLRF